MKSSDKIKVLFLDIGGVLLTNGWDKPMRQRACEKFGIDFDEMNERHNLTFDTYERGLLSLDEYLRRIIFYRKRPFTPDKFKKYMFNLTEALAGNMEMFKKVACANGLKVGSINNEGSELNAHRIRKFHLADLIEFFISSCFVHFRKPDEAIFRLALDVAQAKPGQTLYVDDRPFFIEVAAGLGMNTILHKNLEETKKLIINLGLKTEDK